MVLPPREILTLSLRRLSGAPGFAFGRAAYACAVFIPAVAGALVPMTGKGDREALGFGIFAVQAGIAAVAVVLIVPALVAQLVDQEIRSGRLPLVVIAGRKARAVTDALLFGEILIVFAVLSAGVPLGVVSGLLGGVRPMDAGIAVGGALALAVMGGSVGVLLGASGSAAPAAIAVLASASLASLYGAATWRLEAMLGDLAFAVGALLCLLTADVASFVAARRLDLAASRRRSGVEESEGELGRAVQSRCVPELWPLVESGERLAEPSWLLPWIVGSAVACAYVVVQPLVLPGVDAGFTRELLAAIGVVVGCGGMVLATWYPALRVASLVEPSTLGVLAGTSLRAQSIFDQMERASAGLAAGVLASGVLLLLPEAVARDGAVAAVGLCVGSTLCLFAGIFTASILVGVDAPSARRALASSTLALGLGLSFAGLLWSRLLLGQPLDPRLQVVASLAFLFVASLARSQARHMFRGRWREPLGDFRRLSVW